MTQDAPRPLRHLRYPSRNAGIVGRDERSSGTAGHTSSNPKSSAAVKSDRITAAYVRRTLCPQQGQSTAPGGPDSDRSSPKPLEELLPPLTSSNEIDLQLYAFVAVIINQFIQTWYSKITPDHQFVDEIIHIIAHCTTGLEQRLRATDVEALVLDELPCLLQAHVEAYRIACRTESVDLKASDRRLVYHTLRPHITLSPVPVGPSATRDQQENESIWSQLLVHGVLCLLLPPEDLENPCLRVLVSEVFAEMIVRNGLAGKACEGWLLWEGVTRVIQALQSRAQPAVELMPDTTINRLEQFGLLSSAESTEASKPARGRVSHWWDKTTGAFWLTMQYLMLATITLRAFITALARASALPSRSSAVDHSDLSETTPFHSAVLKPDSNAQHRGAVKIPKRPIISMAIWPCISQMLLLDQRMPWLSGFVSLLQWLFLSGPGKLCGLDSAMDRLLAHYVASAMLSPSLLPPILQTARASLFPGNVLGPTRLPPTAEEIRAIKSNCAATIVDATPTVVSTRFFATTKLESMVKQVEDLLDVFSDPYLNKHFVFAALELIVVRLFPELAAQTVTELLSEKLV